MKNRVNILFVILALSIFSVIVISSADAAAPIDSHAQDALVLASGTQSKVREPFVFVARTPDALDKLAELVSLPDVAFGTDFKKSAIVAAFAGEKPTGGFSVEISSAFDKAIVKEKAPPEDAVVTDVLTAPFAVVSVPVEEEDSLYVDMPDSWLVGADSYTVVSGFFNVTGGFISADKTINVDGKFRLMRSGDLFTLAALEIDSKDGNRKLFETFSGTIDGRVWTAERMEAGDFLERPHPPLKVIADVPGRDLLRLKFVPGKRDYVVNDGFIARGEIAAKKDPEALSSAPGDQILPDDTEPPVKPPPPPPPGR